MSPWCYRYAGLDVVSDLPIPEWAVFEQPEPPAEPDVRVVLRPPRASDPSIAVPATLHITAHEYRFAIPDAGEYCVSDGRQIAITPVAGAGEREMRLFLLGSAFGALCYQRGILVLHASVVEANGRVLAFCGESGAGKSTLAAWLASRGWRLIGDDLCRFDVVDGAAGVYSAAPRLKLWRDALAALGLGTEGLDRDHFRLDKYHQPLAGPRPAAAPLPLSAIYLLDWGPAGATRLTGMAALRRLIASATYRPDLVEPLGALAGHWQRCAELACQVEIWEFTRPRDWSALDLALDTLLRPWTPGLDRESCAVHPR